VRQTVRGEGARALYKGIASSLLAQGLQKATMFFSCYKVACTTHQSDWSSVVPYSVAGWLSSRSRPPVASLLSLTLPRTSLTSVVRGDAQ
jgi:hypothetical protein